MTLAVAEETYANVVSTTLNGGINNSTTSITVNSSTGFPSYGQFRILIDNEIMIVTGGFGTTTWTVLRGQEGTSGASHSTAVAVTHVLTVESLRRAINTNPIGLENTNGQGWFVTACHKSDNQLIYLLHSPDGKRWNYLRHKNILTPGSGNQRDPSIMYYNDIWYIAHTNAANTYWTLLSSTDLVNWTSVANVSMTAITSLNLVWAPEFFIDTDGTVHVFTTCSTGGSTTNFQIYEQHATADDLSTWSTPVIITGTSLRANMIDAFVVKVGSTYNIFYKDDTTKYIEYISSTSLTSGYTITGATNWAGWGSGYEAPSLVKIDTNTWRIYFNQNSGLNSVEIYYSESTNSWATWSSKVATKHPFIPAHITVLRVRDFATLRNMIAAIAEDQRTVGTIVQRTTNQSISNNLNTYITFDSSAVVDDLGWYSGPATVVTVDQPGWYVISAQISTASATSGFVGVFIEINGVPFFAQSKGFQSLTTDQTVSLPYYLDEGSTIKIIIYQNSGGSVNVSFANLSIARMP
jgi:hypothetical protein